MTPRSHGRRKKTAAAMAVNTSPRNSKVLTGTPQSDNRAQFFDRGHQDFPVSSRSNSIATFLGSAQESEEVQAGVDLTGGGISVNSAVCETVT